MWQSPRQLRMWLLKCPDNGSYSGTSWRQGIVRRGGGSEIGRRGRRYPGMSG